jgi:hypothetical protein
LIIQMVDFSFTSMKILRDNNSIIHIRVQIALTVSTCYVESLL